MRQFYFVESVMRIFIFTMCIFLITLFIDLTSFEKIIFLVGGIIWVANPLIESYNKFEEERCQKNKR